MTMTESAGETMLWENDLLSCCANCCHKFDSEAVKITEISGKFDTHGTDANGSVKDYQVTVLKAMSVVYGFPLEKSTRQEENARMWNKNDPCSLCEKCGKIVTAFYQAFQELQILAHEASYLSKGLVQLQQCVQKAFASEHVTDTEKVDNGTGNSPRGRVHKRPASHKNAVPVNEKDNCKNATENENSKSLETVESSFDLEIVKVETLQPPEQCQNTASVTATPLDNVKRGRKKKVPAPLGIEEMMAGTTEIISPNGKVIRTSTRTRKVKTPVDFGESLPKTSATGRHSVGKERKNDKKNVPDLVTPISKTSSDDIDSALWEVCNDLYYKEENLKTLKDGKFVCPDPKCTKAFRGLKTLNKHALQHELDRTYSCSKCDKVFPTHQDIKLHVQQFHVTIIKTEIPTHSKQPVQRLSKPNSTKSKPEVVQSSNATSKKAGIKIRKKYTKLNNNNFPKTDKKYKCEHCDKEFLLKSTYEKHLVSHEKQTAQCRCTVCHQTFPTVLSLSRHITSVHDAKEKTRTPIITEGEGEEHHENSIKQELVIVPDNHVEAFLQDLTSPSEQNLELGKVTRTDPKTLREDKKSQGAAFKCNQCNKQFKRRHQLNLHVLFHNETEPRFGCSQCPKKFFQPNALRTHMLVHTMENPLLCKQCDKVFERRDHYKKHMEVVHDKNRQRKKSKRSSDAEVKSSDTSHACPECKKTFSRNEYLRLHMRIHTGEKPHVCEKCGKQFRDPRNLVQHLVTHKTDRPFCCSVCGLTFKRAHHLNDHEGTHRQNVARPFVCTVAHCGKAFKLRKHLVSHELVHTGSKDHTCHVCGRAFSRKDNLRQHINKIHGKKLADDLLVVVEEQRERHRQAQRTQRQSSIIDDHNEIMESDLDLDQGILSEAVMSTPSSHAADFLTESDQISEVLQIIPTHVATTTLAVPLTSIVVTLASTSTFTKSSYS